MPLDARKTTHIQAIVLKAFAGRQKTVVLVSLAAGVYSYATLLCIFRPQNVVDPQIPFVSGAPPGLLEDLYLIAPIGTSFTGVVYVADTATATAIAVAAANKYEIIEVVPTGIVPGGTHLRVALRRLR